MHAPDNHETAVEDARRRRVPAALLEVQRRGVFKHSASLARWRGAGLEDTDSLCAVFDRRIAWESIGITANTDLTVIILSSRKTHVSQMTYHASIAEQCAACTERVRHDIERRDGARLEVPQSSPGGMAVDLERIVRRTVKEERERWRNNDRFEGDDARSLGLKIKGPPLGRGSSARVGG